MRGFPLINIVFEDGVIITPRQVSKKRVNLVWCAWPSSLESYGRPPFLSQPKSNLRKHPLRENVSEYIQLLESTGQIKH